MLTFTASILPLYGTLVLASSGAYTYTPTANYFGSDSFVFRARDPYSSSTGALVSITINSVPDAPIAIGDTATVAQNSGALIPVLNNDTDVDSTVLTLTGYTNPLQGTIVVAGSGFLYTA